MIKAIFEIFRNNAITARLEALKEAEKNEGVDLIEVKKVAEELPICEDEKKLIESIASQNMNRTTKISPNRSGVLSPQGIVLHHTAGSYAGSVSWCLNAKAKVSYHAIVNTNGDMTILVPDNSRAWANGVSTFKGKSNCNGFMLSIAVSGDTSKRELTAQEIESVAQWCAEKMKQYNFGIEMITTHREIAPKRKTDVDTRAEIAIKNAILRLPCFDTKKEF